MRFLRVLLTRLFRLLPVRPSKSDLEGSSEQMRRSLPANFAAIALNGLFFPTAGRILGAGLLLTWFVSDLTGSATLVAAIIPIQYGLALIAQPIFAEWLSVKQERARYYTVQSILRAALWCALGFASYWINDSKPLLLLSIFFTVIIVDAGAAGIGNIVFSDTLGQVIPGSLRGRARSWRGIFGGVAAGVAGILVSKHFSQSSGVSAFGLLFAGAGALYAIGGFVFGMIEEPEKIKVPDHGPHFSELWGKLRNVWQDKRFRWFLYVEVMLVPITQALPFFTLFARKELGIEAESLGLLIIADAAAPIFGNLIWGSVADAAGNRAAICWAALSGLVAPGLGLFLYLTKINSGQLDFTLFACIVFALGLASAGIDLATKNQVLDLAPDEVVRPLYIGVNDTLVGLPMMLLISAGLLIDLFGFLPMFLCIGALTMIAAVSAMRLLESRTAGD